jgi:hypothetical protein
LRQACCVGFLALATLGPAAPLFGQEPAAPPSSPDLTQEPSPPPAPPQRPAPPQPGAEDATRPLPPSPVVPAPTPGTIFVPPPTVPSTTPPVIGIPGAPGTPATQLFRLRPSITATEEYSDNFFLSSDGRQDNFRSVLSPGATLEINSPFIKGTLGYTPSLAHDSSGSDEVKLFHSLLAGVVWDATPRLKLRLSETFTESDEPSRADRLNLRRERRTFTRNSLTLAADLLIDRIATTGFYRWSTFSEDTASSADASGRSSNEKSDSHTLGLTASTTFLSTNSAAVGYEYLTTDTEGLGVDSGIAGTASTSSSIRGHRFTTTVDRQFTALMRAGITGSYAIRQQDRSSESGSTDDFDIWNVSVFNNYSTGRLTLTGNVGYGMVIRSSGKGGSSITTASSLTYRFARATATVGVESGFAETFSEGQDFGLVRSRGVTGSLSYPFTSAVVGTVTGFYRDNEFPDAGGGFGERTTTTWGGTLTVAVRLTRWLDLLLDYAHTDSSSSGQATQTLFGRDYVENRGRISLRASF